MRLALLRHGHTAWNRAGRIQGRTDIPLDLNARAELAKLTLPDGWKNARIVSSPLSRAVSTARLISDRTAEVVPELIEMGWGVWEGQCGKDLQADPNCPYRDIETWGMDFRPPNGESVGELIRRVGNWAGSLTEDTVAICHIGVMRALLARPLGWDFTGPPPVLVKRNRLYIIENGSFQKDIVRLNERAACA